jgi:hypothetical protein
MFHGYEYQAIVAAEAFGAAHRPHKKNRQKVTFADTATPGGNSLVATAVVTVKYKKVLEPGVIGETFRHRAPRIGQTAKRRIHSLRRMPAQANDKVGDGPIVEPASCQHQIQFHVFRLPGRESRLRLLELRSCGSSNTCNAARSRANVRRLTFRVQAEGWGNLSQFARTLP